MSFRVSYDPIPAGAKETLRFFFRVGVSSSEDVLSTPGDEAAAAAAPAYTTPLAANASEDWLGCGNAAPLLFDEEEPLPEDVAAKRALFTATPDDMATEFGARW